MVFIKGKEKEEITRNDKNPLSLSFSSSLPLPESLSTSPLISPTPSPNAASSKTLCIWPLEKGPRSPPLRAEEQWDSTAAREAKAAASASAEAPPPCCRILSLKAETIARASSIERVTTGSFHEEGRREPECLTRRWEARTEEGEAEAVVVVVFVVVVALASSSHSKVNDELLAPSGASKETLEPFLRAVGLCSGRRLPSTLTATEAAAAEEEDGCRAMRKVLPSEWWTRAPT